MNGSGSRYGEVWGRYGGDMGRYGEICAPGMNGSGLASLAGISSAAYVKPMHSSLLPQKVFAATMGILAR
jgi:hypothetical protein